MKLLARFYDPTSGAIRIDGHDLREVTQRLAPQARSASCRRRASCSRGTVRENIAYGRPDATDEDVRAAAEAVGAAPFIEALPLGYDTPVQERGVRLSIGQRQLVALARALLHDPRLLILDEATSSVDLATEERIEEAIATVLDRSHVVRRGAPPVDHPAGRPDRRPRERRALSRSATTTSCSPAQAGTGRCTATGSRPRACDRRAGNYDVPVNTLLPILQRFLPIVAVVLISVLAHRLVPPSVGILPASSSSRASWWWRCGSFRAASSTGTRARPPPRRAEMARVTVLGLGNMGSALARSFESAGRATTGWTRSGDAGTPAAACAASDLVVGCVLDYAATYEVLAAPGVTETLAGKTCRAAGDRRPGRRPRDGDVGRRRRRHLPRRLDRHVPRADRRRADHHLLLRRPRGLRTAPRDARRAGRPGRRSSASRSEARPPPTWPGCRSSTAT